MYPVISEVLPQGRPTGKFEVAKQVAGVKVSLGKRSGFALRRTGERYPIEEGTRVNVQELSKQILIHEHWRDLVTSQGKLQPTIEGDRVRAQVHDRVDPAIHHGVVSIPVLNRADAGK